jgi:hypothetical protein
MASITIDHTDQLHTPSIQLEVQSLDKVMLNFIQTEDFSELVILRRLNFHEGVPPVQIVTVL